ALAGKINGKVDAGNTYSATAGTSGTIITVSTASPAQRFYAVFAVTLASAVETNATIGGTLLTPFHWSEALVTLTGVAALGQTWNLTLDDGTPIQYAATATDTLATVAAALLARIDSSIYSVTVSTSASDRVLTITRKDGKTFT